MSIKCHHYQGLDHRLFPLTEEMRVLSFVPKLGISWIGLAIYS